MRPIAYKVCTSCLCSGHSCAYAEVIHNNFERLWVLQECANANTEHHVFVSGKRRARRQTLEYLSLFVGFPGDPISFLISVERPFDRDPFDRDLEDLLRIQQDRLCSDWRDRIF
jgi:hypothetical protein